MFDLIITLNITQSILVSIEMGNCLWAVAVCYQLYTDNSAWPSFPEQVQSWEAYRHSSL